MWLEEQNTPLWSKEDISLSSLKTRYKLDELYFIKKHTDTIGLIILQNNDKLIWPEITHNSSLFVHKLCFRKRFKGRDLGKQVISQVKLYAKQLRYQYVRLDCVPRAALLQFYTRCGFSIVDYKTILNVRLARLEYRCFD